MLFVYMFVSNGGDQTWPYGYKQTLLTLTELHPSRPQNCILKLTFYVVLIFAVLLFKLVFEKLLCVAGSYEAATLGVDTQPVLVRFLWSILADSIRCLLLGSQTNIK